MAESLHAYGFVEDIVELRSRLNLADLRREVAVKLTGNADHVMLDADEGRASRQERTLALLHASHRPAYVTRAADGRVTTVRTPHFGRVLRLSAGPDDNVYVQLDRSAAVHVLRRDMPGFEALRDTLCLWRKNKTPVALTSDFTDGNIIDIRPGPIPSDGIGNLFEPTTDLTNEQVIEQLVPVEEATLTEFVRQLNDVKRGKVCRVPDVVEGCIPFTYVKDECWAKAHAVCRLLQSEEIACGKIWVYPPPGSFLRARTVNAFSCETLWHFHVGAMVKLESGELRVIDPSLFPGDVVSEGQFVAAMNVENPVVKLTDTRTYLQPEPDDRAPLSATELESDLRASLTALLDLLDLAEGPPPYARCAI